MTVPVTKPDFRARCDLVGLEKLRDRGDESRRFSWIVDWRWISTTNFIFDWKIDSDNGPEPRQKIRQHFTAQPRISLPGDGNGAIGIDRERCIRKSPLVGADVIFGARLRCGRINARLAKNGYAPGITTQRDFSGIEVCVWRKMPFDEYTVHSNAKKAVRLCSALV